MRTLLNHGNLLNKRTCFGLTYARASTEGRTEELHFVLFSWFPSSVSCCAGSMCVDIVNRCSITFNACGSSLYHIDFHRSWRGILKGVLGRGGGTVSGLVTTLPVVHKARNP